MGELLDVGRRVVLRLPNLEGAIDAGSKALVTIGVDESEARIVVGHVASMVLRPNQLHTGQDDDQWLFGLGKDGMMSKGTTEPGYRNRNEQVVVRKTDLPGNDHNQITYVLRCDECGHEYGSNGSDIFQRRCPAHDGGATGLSIGD